MVPASDPSPLLWHAKLTMDAAIRKWLSGFTCGPCRADSGSERRAGVMVIVRDSGHDLDVIPLCYKHAGIYVSGWLGQALIPP